MRRVVPWLAILGPAAILLFLAYGLTRDPSELPSQTVGTTAPAFDLESLTGDARVQLAAHEGKAVVINFWASWCLSCRAEHDVLIDLGKRFADRDDFAMIGINYRDDKANALSFLGKFGAYPYPSGIDRQGRVGIDYGVYGLPETYFIDASGRIAARHIGPLTPEAAERHLSGAGLAP